MAAKTFRCRLITPEARLLDEDVADVNLPMWDGQMGFLPGRAALVGKLGEGELRMTFGAGGKRSYYVEDGFVQMLGDKMTVLATKAVPSETLSEQDAQAELSEALARNVTGGTDMDRVTRDRRRARAKLALARQFKSRGGGI